MTDSLCRKRKLADSFIPRVYNGRLLSYFRFDCHGRNVIGLSHSSGNRKMNTLTRCWGDNATWQSSRVAAKNHQRCGLRSGRFRKKSQMDVATFLDDDGDGRTAPGSTAMVTCTYR